MEVKGTIVKVMPVEIVENKDKTKQWNKGSFVIKEDSGEYPKEIAFDLFGKKCDELHSQLSVGSTVTVSFNLESKEFNGRWFTAANAWKLDIDVPVGQPTEAEEDTDDLPF